MELHIFRGGQSEGPFTENTVRRMLAEGELALSDQAWHEELPDWVPLARLFPSDPYAPPERGSDSTTLHVLMPAAPAFRPPAEPASPKQKAFLSYMGITFAPGLTRERASVLVSEAMENPNDPARLDRWGEERLRLHPEIFASELLTRKEERPSRFHALVRSEGAECFHDVSLAHCQVLVTHLDVRFPNWDAREKEAVWTYFFPALAEQFPQLVKKPWRNKLHLPKGPRVATELQHEAPPLPPLHPGPLLILRALSLLVLLLGLGTLTAYLVRHPELGQAWRNLFTRTPVTESGEAEKEWPTVIAVAPEPPANGANSPEAPASVAPPARPPGVELPGTGEPASPSAPTLPALDPPAEVGPAAPTPAPENLLAARPRETVTVLRSLELQLAYGKVRLRPGTQFKVVSQEGAFVKVRYLDSIVALPLSATDWH